MSRAELAILSARAQGLVRALLVQPRSKHLIDENNNPTFEYAQKFHVDKNGSYTIVATLNQSNIDPGGRIGIYIYFTGYRNINWNKLHLTLSTQEFLVESRISEEKLGQNSEDNLTLQKAFENRLVPGRVAVRMVIPSNMSASSKRGTYSIMEGLLYKKV